MPRRALLVVPLCTLGLAGGASGVLAGSPAVTGATTAPPAGSGTLATQAAAVATVAAETAATTPRTLVVSGHGFGHGVGMSQWGAYGYALHGWTYDRILAHYYPGTNLGAAAVSKVRVLLLLHVRRVVLGSAGPWHVVDASGTKLELPAGTLVLNGALRVASRKLVPPLLFTAGPEPLAVGGRLYRGKLVVTVVGRKLDVVDSLGLEGYLKGVVPAEIPFDWPVEALEAQAVASRSYALAELATVPPGSSFDLYTDTRSQVYGGIEAEKAATSRAVEETAGRVVLYHGAVATTYFFSSSGGRTESALDLTGTVVPYLVSVADPYDSLSPYHDWGPVLFDAGRVAKALKLHGPLLDLSTTLGASGRVESVTAEGASTRLTVPGTDLRVRLGLRSTWFTVGWLTLTPPPAPVAFGAAALLAGTARGVSGVQLEQRAPGSDWQPVEVPKPGADGAFAVSVRPRASTQYRLTAAGVQGALASVAVAPTIEAAVRPAAGQGPGTVQGSVRPALAGTPIQLQRQAGTSWATVAAGSTDVRGSFVLSARLVPGSYRVRAAPGRGLAPGVSRTLPVP